MRSLTKNKFLLCFRPVVDIDCMIKSEVAPCRFPRIDSSDQKNDESKSMYFPHVSPKRRISRVIKAMFYETILNRRDHHKNRYIHDSFGPKYLSYEETKTLQSPLSTSSSNSSHGLASPISSSSSHALKNVPSCYYSTKEKRKEDSGPLVEKQKNKLELCFGIYLILISLAFTVFWGKLFGTILTSTLLYFFAVWDSSSPCTQKRLLPPSSPRLTLSPQAKDARNIYHMAMVPINIHVTHSRHLQLQEKINKSRRLCIM